MKGHRWTTRPRRRVLMALGYYDPQLHRGIVRFAHQAGWVLDTSMAHYGVIPHHWSGDGILAILIPDRPDIQQYIAAHPATAVALYADVPEVAIPRVVLDDARIGGLAAQHLLERGFSDLGFYRVTDLVAVQERERGFRDEVQRSGRRYHLLDWHRAAQDQAAENSFEWLKNRLSQLPLPIAIMAQSDHRAAYLVSACEAAGLAVPEDVAVIGVDNEEYACELAAVPISSVDANREQMAYEGARLLDQLMAGEVRPPAVTVITPQRVVVRQSSDIFAIPDRAVARALAFIRDHYQQPIRVKDVVVASRASRCQLYRAFTQHLQRSVGSEIDRQRVDHAQHLLLERREKLYRIARICGFSGPEHFTRVFQRLTGETPSQFRGRGKRSG